MHPVEMFELVLGMLIAILVLHWAAEQLRWPPSVALLIGGGALAFIPGIPTIHIDPELVLVLFLPPLLMDGAWNTALVHFRRHFVGILSLAVGAVIFTTLVVAVVAHWLMPSLPWAACAALGAIVAPPDAVSARSVLQRVELPRRLSTLIEGESLLNDATGLVIFRFAVAAAMGSGFDAGAAVGQFAMLAIGGTLVGLAVGMLWVLIARAVRDELLQVVMSVLVGWTSYLIAEQLHVSGVLATVTAGLVLGWYQHTIFTAAVRMKGTSFWIVLVFLLEASVFMLIGFSLRDILERAGGIEVVLQQMAWPVLAIVLSLTVARLAWIMGSDFLLQALSKAGLHRNEPLGLPAGLVMGWAGMRGVVTLAVALTLPETMPGRDFMLVTAFGVILVTVVLQGSTLGLLIRLTGLKRTKADAPPMTMAVAEASMIKAQLTEVEKHAHDADGKLIHPQLLARYSRHAAAAEKFSGSPDERAQDIKAHFDVVIAASIAGRAELVRLHRLHLIDDETLLSLEHDLDLQELAAISAKE
ncbi:Na+/H+ antiporter [Pararhizobium sp.]|uniref:Na+/H+ antiporter n=1 Tax=Pararhizobium sp. TaxID=1977563 RepID=UPI00271A542A|nr:Na+/H+ antiporter [Pararhizobium sp.]MDO9417254.1 Na+/H+ antiporter [Pararhizobium sp.]